MRSVSRQHQGLLSWRKRGCRNELHMERPSPVGPAKPTVTTKFKYIAVGWKAYLSGPAPFHPSSVGPLVTNKAYTPHTLCLLSWCCIATEFIAKCNEIHHSLDKRQQQRKQKFFFLSFYVKRKIGKYENRKIFNCNKITKKENNSR